MKNVLVTGGAGFIGSHFAEDAVRRGHKVTVIDNLSRGALLLKKDPNRDFVWNALKRSGKIRLVRADVRKPGAVDKFVAQADVILHAAGQTAVTTSVTHPEPDFTTNALGTFRVLEAARKGRRKPAIVYCSTNKVYGHNVNDVPLAKSPTRWKFSGRYAAGVPETFSVDLCEHTPYGCSKLTADLYMQDYARLYGLRTGVFRMSCIYGTRQFGFEDQGWVAWFTIATLLGKPLTIFGDGRQVRDVLFVDDLIRAYWAFIDSRLPHGVFNMGGGAANTLSLLELLDTLESLTGRRSKVAFKDWRPSDQKVYISDIGKAKRRLGWSPKIAPKEGVSRLVDWVRENQGLFSHL